MRPVVQDGKSGVSLDGLMICGRLLQSVAAPLESAANRCRGHFAFVCPGEALTHADLERRSRGGVACLQNEKRGDRFVLMCLNFGLQAGRVLAEVSQVKPRRTIRRELRKPSEV